MDLTGRPLELFDDTLLSIFSIDSVKSCNNWRSRCAILFNLLVISSKSSKLILLDAKTYGAVFEPVTVIFELEFMFSNA